MARTPAAIARKGRATTQTATAEDPDQPNDPDAPGDNNPGPGPDADPNGPAAAVDPVDHPMTYEEECAAQEKDDIRDLLTRIGFSDEAAILITDDNGLSTVNRLRDLDDARCESLARVIRKTKSVVNPQTYVTVPDLAIRNLQLAIFAIKHFDRTSRDKEFGLENITDELLSGLHYQRIEEEASKNETITLPKLTLSTTP